MPSLSTLNYEPLDSISRQIRLLRIVPEPTALEFVLRTYDIDRCPPYVALSYAWGSGPAGQTITINGAEFPVRENLLHALQQLNNISAAPRQVSDTNDGLEALATGQQVDSKVSYRNNLIDNITTFWIDAICINQDDNLEKGHQVNMMSDIFSNATLVVAWLGQEADDAYLAIDALKHHTTSLDDLPSWYAGYRLYPAMCALLGRSYFQRMWIVQEVLLARRLLFLCGTSAFSWNDLTYFCYNQFLWKQHFDGQPLPEGPRDLMGAQRLIRGSGTDTLRALLTRLHFRKCSDLRDKVYALLGIVLESHDKGSVFAADYNLPLESVYLRTILFLNPNPGRSHMEFELMNILDLPVEMKPAFDHAVDFSKGLRASMDYQAQLNELDVENQQNDRDRLLKMISMIEENCGGAPGSLWALGKDCRSDRLQPGSSESQALRYLLKVDKNMQDLVRLIKMATRQDRKLAVTESDNNITISATEDLKTDADTSCELDIETTDTSRTSDLTNPRNTAFLAAKASFQFDICFPPIPNRGNIGTNMPMPSQPQKNFKFSSRFEESSNDMLRRQ